jgi:hypothetical protein
MTEAVECKGISVSLWLDQACRAWGKIAGMLGQGRPEVACTRAVDLSLRAKTSQTERVEPAMEADLAYSGGIRYRFFGGISMVRGLLVVGGYLGL